MGQSSQTINPVVPEAVKPLANRLEGMAGNTKTPVTPYKGLYASGQTPGENQALSYLRGRTYNGSPLTQRGGQLISDTLSGKYLSPSSNPYLDETASAISNKASAALGQSLDNYDSGANSRGAYFSTGANNLRRNAFHDFSNSLQGQLAALYGGNYSSERSNQVGTLSDALNYGNQDFGNAQTLYGDESVGRGIQDTNLKGGYQDFLRTNQETQYQNELPYNQLLSLLQGYPLANPSYSPGRSGYQDAGAILGPLAMLAVAGAR